MVTEIREIRPKIAVEKVLEDRAMTAKELREELEAARRIKEKNDLMEEGIIHVSNCYECCFSRPCFIQQQQLLLLMLLPSLFLQL